MSAAQLAYRQDHSGFESTLDDNLGSKWNWRQYRLSRRSDKHCNIIMWDQSLYLCSRHWTYCRWWAWTAQGGRACRTWRCLPHCSCPLDTPDKLWSWPPGSGPCNSQLKRPPTPIPEHQCNDHWQFKTSGSINLLHTFSGFATIIGISDMKVVERTWYF